MSLLETNLTLSKIRRIIWKTNVTCKYRLLIKRNSFDKAT